MHFSPEIEERLAQLQEKYEAMGQDMTSYLDGLLYADFLTYWDYIHLDTLLSLQSPKTPFPDEQIFIMYHQITELYFKLVLHECEQITAAQPLTPLFFTARLKRINNYFEALTQSFDIMIDGMEKEQFLKFRMSLLPASGFQSGQYRMIEIYATDFINLVAKDKRDELRNKTIEDQFEYIYWKFGATELSTGKKTLTLKQFEKKYAKTFIDLGKAAASNNFYALYNQLKSKGESTAELETELKQLDTNVNVNWPLVHYKSAVRYLNREPEEIKATGGTNWQKYLPPRFQKRIFYPGLWNEQELENWGKAWVEKVLKDVDAKG
ncbi:tryptophan 2,3-dioxygenase [Mucilaginibacter sp. BJC16-A38]|uniref:tryptophan 2,3-dioxygenase family protein n=1 Tax=Mucilaginibacter phenanthrenivorans TaxID=1234842 RepID=UPI0021581628|nr:tryptophan 2,3-dioxygenase family protein [Mucilaginibacter phenanthrenivorans]MCR8561933.1 tryptophan 2,3-dioxygenase [Mucilaginibacter phenanthrenivorans]